MKKTILTLLTCILSTALWAVPARRVAFNHTQKDGTVLTLVQMGDEHFHYFLETNTGQKMYRNVIGDYDLLTEERFEQLKTAGEQRMQIAAEKREQRLAKNSGRSLSELNNLSLTQEGPKRVGVINGNMKGDKKGLVILVEFQDLQFAPENTRDILDASFNEVGYSRDGHVGSVHDYFHDQSYGEFNLTFDVVGPVTVSKNYAYYGKNGYSGSDMYPGKMVAEACKLVDDIVDYGDYDWDGDGEVDQVFVIYAGYGEHAGADSNTIWPHEYWLSYSSGTSAQKLDGKIIDTYACSCERRGSGIGTTLCGIGTACHEFSHCIGYPDFYDTTYSGGFGMYAWDLLDTGCYNGPEGWGEVPCGYTSYERWQAGWLSLERLTEGCLITDFKDLGSTPQAYVLVNARNNNEYFLLENRRNTKWFSYIMDEEAGHGMLVTHVDYSSSSWQGNRVNNSPSHQRMSIIPADGDYGTKIDGRYCPTGAESKGDLFPGTKNVTVLTDDSHVNCGGKLFNKNTDGTYFMHLPLTNIAEDNEAGTISFTFNGGPDDGMRYTVTYDTGDNGTCTESSWTQQKAHETTTLPEAVTDASGWKFIGWSLQPLESETEQRPKDLMMPGDSYLPTADITLYAVYGICQEGWHDTFVLTDTLQPRKRYVFATTADIGTGIALDTEKLKTSTQRFVIGTFVTAETIGTSYGIIVPAESLIFESSESLNGIILKNGKYNLGASNSGLNLSTGSTAFGIDSTYGLYANSSNGSTRFYIYETNGKFNVSAAGKAESRLYAFVYDSAPEGLTIYSSFPHELVGLSEVVTSHTTVPLYDLQGRRLSQPAHGLYIQSGRKVMK